MLWKSIQAKIWKEYCMRCKKMSIYDLKIESLRKQGMKIGKNCCIFSDIFSKEPYLISIGDNTTISGDVILLTHDNSISKYLTEFTDLFGRIDIGKNCFIGMRSMILPGVTLADNTIVGAGAVVTKSVTQPGLIVAGSPARVIGTIEDLKKKNVSLGYNIRGLSAKEKKKLLESFPQRIIKR